LVQTIEPWPIGDTAGIRRLL